MSAEKDEKKALRNHRITNEETAELEREGLAQSDGWQK